MNSDSMNNGERSTTDAGMPETDRNRQRYMKTALNFSFFFLIIYSYYIAKPIRNSLFLEWMGPAQLPYIYMLSALITLVGAFVLDRVMKFVKPVRLVPSVILMFSLIYLLFWWLFRTQGRLGASLSFVLYLYISFFAVVSVTLFWAVCNDTHSPSEGKASYNLIGLGGILGGLAGGETTKLLAQAVGTENLLLISAGLLLVTLPLPYLIISRWRREGQPVPEAVTATVDDTAVPGFVTVFKNHYVLSIAGLVLIATLTASLLDYQFQGIIKNAGMAKDVRTAFMGRIFTLVSLAGIAVHLLLSKPVLKKFGAFGGLLPLPVIALAAAMALYLYPGLSVVTVCWVAFGGFSYSLNQITRETLYLPVPRHLKYRAKFYIDTFVFRFGDTCAAFIILFTGMFAAGYRGIYLAYGIAAGLVWIGLVFHYRNRFMRHNENDTAISQT